MHNYVAHFDHCMCSLKSKNVREEWQTERETQVARGIEGKMASEAHGS